MDGVHHGDFLGEGSLSKWYSPHKVLKKTDSDYCPALNIRLRVDVHQMVKSWS